MNAVAKKILLMNLNKFTPEIQDAAKSILNELDIAEKKISELEKKLDSVTNLPGETWKDVKDYEGLYQISNKGRVKSLRWAGGKVLKFGNSGFGYFFVNLSKNNKCRNFFVHTLVARAFIPNPENKPEVNHIDGNKKNNCVENLEWVTESENHLHAYKTGLRKRSNSKLSDEDVRFIREHYKFRNSEYNTYSLARMFQVCPVTILNIVHNKNYKTANESSTNNTAEFDNVLKELSGDIDTPGYDEELLKVLTASAQQATNLINDYGNFTDDSVVKQSASRAEYTPPPVTEKPAEEKAVVQNQQRFIVCPKCGEKIWL